MDRAEKPCSARDSGDVHPLTCRPRARDAAFAACRLLPAFQPGLRGRLIPACAPKLSPAAAAWCFCQLSRAALPPVWFPTPPPSSPRALKTSVGAAHLSPGRVLPASCRPVCPAGVRVFRQAGLSEAVASPWWAATM